MLKEVYFDKIDVMYAPYWNYLFDKYAPVNKAGTIQIEEAEQLRYFPIYQTMDKSDNLRFSRYSVDILEVDGKLKVSHYRSMDIKIPRDIDLMCIVFATARTAELDNLEQQYGKHIYSYSSGTEVLEISTTDPLHLKAGDTLVIKPFHFFVDKL